MNKGLKFISTILSLIFVISFASCSGADVEISESLVDSSTIIDNSIHSSLPDNKLDISNESSDIDENSPYTSVSFLACPDNLIHPCIYYDAIERAARKDNTEPKYKDLHNAKYDFSPIYENVKEIISEADISYLNQESLIGGTSGSVYGYPHFNSPNAMGDTVSNLGFDIVNVAHNHMLDSANSNYLVHCYNFFEERNVNVLGYYENNDATNDIMIIEKNGIKIAFLTYTFSTNGETLEEDSDIVIPFFDETLIKKQVAIAKDNADFIIASCHWGAENTHTVNSYQKKYAKFLTNLEVDVVLGMHPHCIQPMEWQTSESGKKTLVVYSLGNFVSGMDRGINNLGCMLSFDVSKNIETGEIQLVEPNVIPFVNHYTKEDEVAGDDKGYRNYQVFLLKDYTDELAAIHGAHSYEAKNGTTLEGGAFSKQTLLNTFYKYIPAEFYYPIK